jgi:hypothetical protein
MIFRLISESRSGHVYSKLVIRFFHHMVKDAGCAIQTLVSWAGLWDGSGGAFKSNNDQIHTNATILQPYIQSGFLS